MQQIGFVLAMKEHFGLLPGQATVQYGAELRAMSEREKREFATPLQAAGIDCPDPAPAKAAA